jgi:hypothetical protein
MKKLIHKYLFENFYFKDKKLYSPTIKGPVNSHECVNQLILIFGLTKKELKWYVKDWFKKNNILIFNEWWKPFISFRWKPIAGDLITVQPMTAPSGTLHYLDYRYGVDPINVNPTFYNQIVSVSSRRVETTDNFQ